MAQRIAHRARFPAVHGIAVHNHPYPVKVPLRLKHPLIAVVHRAIVVRNHFKFVMRIVAAADAPDGFIDRLALVVAGQDDADRRLIGIVLFDLCARHRPLQNGPQRVLDDRDHQAKKHNQPDQCRGHGASLFLPLPI